MGLSCARREPRHAALRESPQGPTRAREGSFGSRRAESAARLPAGRKTSPFCFQDLGPSADTGLPVSPKGDDPSSVSGGHKSFMTHSGLVERPALSVFRTWGLASRRFTGCHEAPRPSPSRYSEERTTGSRLHREKRSREVWSLRSWYRSTCSLCTRPVQPSA